MTEAKTTQAISPAGGAAIFQAGTTMRLVPLGNEYTPNIDPLPGEVRQLWATVTGDDVLLYWIPGKDPSKPRQFVKEGEVPPGWEGSPSARSGNIVLPISHLSQSDMYSDSNYAPGDCGPVVMASVGQSRGKYYTPDTFSHAVTLATGRPAGYQYTYLSDLERLGAWYAIPCQRATFTEERVMEELFTREQPIIALVHAGDIPGRSYSFSKGHYILIVGKWGEYYLIHDPNEPRTGRGSFKRVTWAQLARMWQRATLDNNQAFTGIRFL